VSTFEAWPMEPFDSTRESRSNPRYPVTVRVNICFSKNGFLQRATVKALDISASGISVQSPLPLPQDAPVEVEITLPGTKVPMRVKAVIRNKHGVRYGVEFLSATEAQKSDITRFGSARRPSSGDSPEMSLLPAAN
jgi:PilZ domain